MGKAAYSEPPPPGGAAAHYIYDRARNDRLWAWVLAAFWLACLGLGVYCVAHRNSDFIKTNFTDPASCPAGGRKLLEADEPKGFDVSQFMHAAGRWLAVSAAGAILVGAAFLHLVKHQAHWATRATIGVQIALPSVAGRGGQGRRGNVRVMGVAFLAQGIAVPAIMMFLMTGLTALVFGWWRNEIGLASRLLGVSAHGLVANSGLITATLLLNIASVVAIVPLVVLSAFAFMNGEVVPNPARAGAAQCVDAQGAKVQCCSWAPDAVAKAYLSLAGVTMLWTVLLANQIRVFVVSGTVAQWYFAPAGAPTAGNLSRSLRHATGPQLGSLCLSSAILTVANMMRQALEQAQQDNRDGNLLTLCLILLAQCFWSLVEFLTKFATVFMAITGEAFFSAGRKVTDLLLRNFLNTFASTIWFTPMVINLACVVLSVAWGLLSGFGYWLLHRGTAAELNAGTNATVLGVAVGLIVLFVLNFTGGILLSVLDAAFVCWAIDKDSQTVSNVAVHEVFQTVPLPGAAVEQPDGDIHYGAPQTPYQPPVVQQRV
eukprot:scaffold21.g2136.t1